MLLIVGFSASWLPSLQPVQVCRAVQDVVTRQRAAVIC
jgi:hypothetical protein